MHLPYSSICATSSVFLLAIGLIGVFNREVAWRYPGFVEKWVAGRGMYNSRTCFLEGDQAPDAWRGAECFISSGHDVNVMLWGDSFAAHYAPGIVEEAGRLDVNILQYPPLAEETRPQKHSKFEKDPPFGRW